MTPLDGRHVAPLESCSGAEAPAAPTERLPSRARHRRRTERLQMLVSPAYAAGSLLLLLAAWWVASILIGNGQLLATPAQVWHAAIPLIKDGTLAGDIAASGKRALAGFALGTIAAIPVGFALGWYPLCRRLVEPWLQFMRVIPPIAIIPLVILWLGIGEEGKIFLIFWASFLQVVIAVVGGVSAVDAVTIRAARVLGARDLSIFLDIAVPASIPYVLVGMRIGLAASWTTLVAAELVAASSGLGYRIVSAGNYRQVPVVMLGIITIGILGFLMDRVFLIAEKRLTSWQERAN
ncbi:ABC transporter permease [Streptomyces tubercidicus]|uniref:ABC transporter permease n=1 Tax=Streptomyces tubercidicus TaxID=47759 RepID=UPI00367BC5E7